MLDTPFIDKSAPLLESQDYALLRKRGIEHVEALAHERWTDYNVHDPGITFLELLCYAITDLGYRTEFAVQDLLTRLIRGEAVNTSTFHTARAIFPCNPITFGDLRKVLIDIEGVRNAWIDRHTGIQYGIDPKTLVLVECATPTAGCQPAGPLNGLFDVQIEYDEFVQREERIVPLGLAARTADGGYIQSGRRGLLFHVDHPLIIRGVHVYAEVAGPVHLRVLDADGHELVRHTSIVPRADEKIRVPLDFAVQPGRNYRLVATGTRLYREAEAAFPFQIDNVIHLEAGVFGDQLQQQYYFFYDWEITYAIPPPSQIPVSTYAYTEITTTGPIVTAPEITRDDVLLEVRNRLFRHRNLCEDVVNVCDLDVEEIGICADIEVIPSANIDAVLADLFYQLGLHVSPPVHFYSIQELLDKGKSTDVLFEGPLLDHGFIDDDEFRTIERRCRLLTSDLIRIIMDDERVVAVKEISLLSFVDGEPRVETPWVLELAIDRFRAPQFSPGRSKIIFYKNDLPYYANTDRVTELLDERKAQNLPTKLKGHEQDLPVPVGVFRDLADYYPIQNELPAAYLVGQNRVPDSASELRKAQAKQLKGYLLFFDQILANYHAQLANIDTLFSWEQGDVRSYFSQEVGEILDIESLYIDHSSLQAKLEEIAEDKATAHERKLRFLEHLLARFAESTADYALMMVNLLGQDAGSERVIADRQCLLSDYPRASAERGKGFDYRYPTIADNLSGYQRRVYRLLGMRDASGEAACAIGRRDLAGHRFELVFDEPSHTWYFVLSDEAGGALLTSISCETEASIEALLDFAFTIGGDVANYASNGSGYDLMRVCRGEGADERIGYTADEASLDAVVAYFAAYAGTEGFHVVEHILLRKRTSGDPFLPVQIDEAGDCTCPEVRDPYSFRMSVVLPSWPARFKDLKFRQFVEQTLRMEAPAHVFTRICWVSHEQMKQFETAHNAWLNNLAGLENRLGGCCLDLEAGQECRERSGQFPLPPTEAGEVPQQPTADEAYAASLAALIDVMHGLHNVYPMALLHDCDDVDSDAPQISLNNTTLGTF